MAERWERGDEGSAREPDHPPLRRLEDVPDTPADPKQFEGRYLTPEIEQAIKQSEASGNRRGTIG